MGGKTPNGIMVVHAPDTELDSFFSDIQRVRGELRIHFGVEALRRFGEDINRGKGRPTHSIPATGPIEPPAARRNPKMSRHNHIVQGPHGCKLPGTFAPRLDMWRDLMRRIWRRIRAVLPNASRQKT